MEWRGALAASAILLVVSTMPVESSPRDSSNRRLKVLIVNHAAVPLTTLNPARGEVTRLFRVIGIEVDWITEVPGDGIFFSLVVVPLPSYDVKVEPNAMGATIGAPGQPRARAYVFFERVLEVVRTKVPDIVVVLAVAMAHEIGHLIETSNGHARDGLMKRALTLEDLELAVKGRLMFSDESARLFRRWPGWK